MVELSEQMEAYRDQTFPFDMSYKGELVNGLIAQPADGSSTDWLLQASIMSETGGGMSTSRSGIRSSRMLLSCVPTHWSHPPQWSACSALQAPSRLVPGTCWGHAH